MQDEFDAAGMNVTIVGLNAVGLEDGNGFITMGRDLPWLQDVPEEEVWATWGITYRDVVILDANNEVLAIYNLTQHNLGDASNYAELYDLFATAATP